MVPPRQLKRDVDSVIRSAIKHKTRLRVEDVASILRVSTASVEATLHSLARDYPSPARGAYSSVLDGDVIRAELKPTLGRATKRILRYIEKLERREPVEEKERDVLQTADKGTEKSSRNERGLFVFWIHAEEGRSAAAGT